MLYVHGNRPTWMLDTIAVCIYVVATANCLRLSVESCIVYCIFFLSSLCLYPPFRAAHSPFSTLWNVQFCAVRVGLSAPWR